MGEQQRCTGPESAHIIMNLCDASQLIGSALGRVPEIDSLPDLDKVQDAVGGLEPLAGRFATALAARREEIEAEKQDDEKLGDAIVALFATTRAYALGLQGAGFTTEQLREHLDGYFDFGDFMSEEDFGELFAMVRKGITADMDDARWSSSETEEGAVVWGLVQDKEDSGETEVLPETTAEDAPLDKPLMPDPGQQDYLLGSVLRVLRSQRNKGGMELSDLVSRSSHGAPGEMDPGQTRAFLNALIDKGIIVVAPRGERTMVSLVAGVRTSPKDRSKLLAELTNSPDNAQT